MSNYYKAFNTLKGPVTQLKNIISSAIGKKGKKSPTIKSVKPAVGSLTKRRKDTEEVFGVRSRHGVTPNKKTGETVKKISKINDKLDKLRPGKKHGGRMGKMGGGMMGRRMGYSQGSSKGKVPTTPKEKALAKLAPPKDKITFGDVVAGRTKGAKNGKTMS